MSNNIFLNYWSVKPLQGCYQKLSEQSRYRKFHWTPKTSESFYHPSLRSWNSSVSVSNITKGFFNSEWWSSSFMHPNFSHLQIDNKSRTYKAIHILSTIAILKLTEITGIWIDTINNRYSYWFMTQKSKHRIIICLELTLTTTTTDRSTINK